MNILVGSGSPTFARRFATEPQAPTGGNVLAPSYARAVLCAPLRPSAPSYARLASVSHGLRRDAGRHPPMRRLCAWHLRHQARGGAADVCGEDAQLERAGDEDERRRPGARPASTRWCSYCKLARDVPVVRR